MDKPKDDARGEWTYRCTSCGNEVDEDHDYCARCDQRGGEWELTGPDGEPVDTNIYGIDTFNELVNKADLLIKELRSMSANPEFQTVIDSHGNRICDHVLWRMRNPMDNLTKVITRAKKGN